ncbi:hypothetical protein SAMN05216570_0135 [Dyella sp. OK004]|uniref:hypothetical protein n=1 Tax=Dyella sp. OK004 TaxID=1855292 RepID=UPI0008E179C7|nr:hypothetical protein [Dyella sp. OK004]SFR86770.1 hypothetical protein SAMN05216570_0135 [Dyella sp. OK004]
MKKLLDIADALETPKQGVVLVGRTKQKDAMLQAGDLFELRLPTGHRRTLTALGVQPFPKCFTEATTLGILVGDQWTELETGIGSELWVNLDSGQHQGTS